MAAGLLVALLLLLKTSGPTEETRGERASMRRTEGLSPAASDENEPGKPTKTGRLRESRKTASDEDQKKFARFFLPPVKLENASLEEAMDKIIAAYAEAAAMTQEQPQDLRVDVSGARPDAILNCTTPRAPADTVIRYLAALTGHRVKGSLPDFRLAILEQSADRQGSLEEAIDPDMLAAFFERQKKPTEAKLGKDPFSEEGEAAQESRGSTLTLQELLHANGFNEDAEFTTTPDGQLRYKNLSEAEVELLGMLARFSSPGESGPIQMKASTVIVQLDDSLAQTLSNGMVLSSEQSRLAMRELLSSQKAGVMSMPVLMTHEGQSGKIVIDGQKPASSEEGDTWTGVRMASASVPLGLGSEVEYAFEIRDPSGQRTKAISSGILPAGGNGVMIAPQADGKKIVFMQTAAPMDARGRLLSEAP